MSYDAKQATYQEVTILGKPALFTECRLDRTTVPEGVYRYELRHADEDWGEPATLSRSIVVNYYGSVLTREPFQLPVEGWIPLESGSLSFRDGISRPVPIWSMEPAYTEPVIETLEATFGTLAEKDNLPDAILSASRNAVADNMQDYLRDLLDCRGGSMLEELDALNVEVTYRRALERALPICCCPGFLCLPQPTYCRRILRVFIPLTPPAPSTPWALPPAILRRWVFGRSAGR